MTDRTWLGLPSHVIVMLGASTAAYALVLAGVAGVQSRNEADLAALRAPAVEGVQGLAAGHDAIDARLRAAQDAYNAAVQAYTNAGGSLDTVELNLQSFAAVAGEIDGVARSMPTSVKLPPVHRSSGAGAPGTHGTTGASGG
ncbi:MAG TPA: hypothetical protein VJ850_03430 [Candidatus Limnocylindrales bacterium]|nr:hypothetical protein [Candidatus Limnocylindrales bacterium]